MQAQSGKKESPAQKRVRILQEQKFTGEIRALKHIAREELFNARVIGRACWRFMLRKAGWDAATVEDNVRDFDALRIDTQRLIEDGQIAILVPRDREKITLGFIGDLFGVVFDFVGFRNSDGSENSAIKSSLRSETLPEGSVIIIDRVVRKDLAKRGPTYQERDVQARGETLNSLVPFILKNVLFYALEKSVLGDSVITRVGAYSGVSCAASWIVEGSNPHPCINIYKDNGILVDDRKKHVSMCGCVIIGLCTVSGK